MNSTALHQPPRTEEERHYYALNAKVWPVFAPFYDVLTRPLRRLRRAVVNQAGVAPGSRVLDVATGTGAQALAFADAGADVIGIDLCEAMLRIARKKAGAEHVEFRQADASELPFEDGRFDVTCVSFGLHEMPETVRRRVLLEMARVTKPSGKIIVVDYALPRNPLASTIVYHLVKLYERDNYAEFVRADLHAMLRQAGLAEATERSVPSRAALRWSPARIVIASRAAP